MQKNSELLKAIILLPGSVLVLIPGIILYFTRPVSFLGGAKFHGAWVLLGAGLFFTLSGIFFAAKTIFIFLKAGEGTPAPWAPPKRFVVTGPYGYVRNPMILSVLSILSGEALLFGSFPVLIWCAAFWLINTVYLSQSEEPGLVLRFGEDYLEYKKHVRRWIPRLKPWKQNTQPSGLERDRAP